MAQKKIGEPLRRLVLVGSDTELRSGEDIGFEAVHEHGVRGVLAARSLQSLLVDPLIWFHHLELAGRSHVVEEAEDADIPEKPQSARLHVRERSEGHPLFPRFSQNPHHLLDRREHVRKRAIELVVRRIAVHVVELTHVGTKLLVRHDSCAVAPPDF